MHWDCVWGIAAGTLRDWFRRLRPRFTSVTQSIGGSGEKANLAERTLTSEFSTQSKEPIKSLFCGNFFEVILL